MAGKTITIVGVETATSKKKTMVKRGVTYAPTMADFMLYAENFDPLTLKYCGKTVAECLEERELGNKDPMGNNWGRMLTFILRNSADLCSALADALPDYEEEQKRENHPRNNHRSCPGDNLSGYKGKAEQEFPGSDYGDKSCLRQHRDFHINSGHGRAAEPAGVEAPDQRAGGRDPG